MVSKTIGATSVLVWSTHFRPSHHLEKVHVTSTPLTFFVGVLPNFIEFDNVGDASIWDKLCVHTTTGNCSAQVNYDVNFCILPSQKKKTWKLARTLRDHPAPQKVTSDGY